MELNKEDLFGHNRVPCYESGANITWEKTNGYFDVHPIISGNNTVQSVGYKLGIAAT